MVELLLEQEQGQQQVLEVAQVQLVAMESQALEVAMAEQEQHLQFLEPQ
jgi:hypothetical protein